MRDGLITVRGSQTHKLQSPIGFPSSQRWSEKCRQKRTWSRDQWNVKKYLRWCAIRLADILEIEPTDIGEGDSFADDLDADSLALIELVEAIEEDLSERSVGFSYRGRRPRRPTVGS